MAEKGLGMNAGKTKVMQCRLSSVQSEDSGKHPCDVCRKGVASNSISSIVSQKVIKDVMASRGIR